MLAPLCKGEADRCCMAKPVSSLQPQRSLEEPLRHLWKLLKDPLAWLQSVALSRMMMYCLSQPAQDHLVYLV